MKVLAALLGMLLFAGLAVVSAATGRDPLNNDEIDQLRDVAQEPDKRIPLYLKFIKARAASLEELRNDPRWEAARAARLHDLLEDIDTLFQEMDDNIGVYARQRLDLRKPLKAVVAVTGELEPKLRAMKDAGDTQTTRSYAFALDNALDSIKGSRENAEQILQEQEEAFKKAQKKK
jgi:hypothetical protein